MLDRSSKTRRYRICHIASTTDGATWMFEQLRDLRDKYGFDVSAIVSGDRGALIDKLVSENIPFHVADFTAGTGSPRAILRIPFAVLRLMRIIRHERFDVVQTHIFTTMIIGRPAAWLADVPVRTAMIAGPYHLQAHTSRWLERLTFWMDTRLISACEKTLELCRELAIPEKRLSPVIYYSPDERKFDPQKILPANIRAEFGWPQDTPLIGHVAFFYPRLSVGRWVPKEIQQRSLKGHEELIETAPLILREFPDTKILLVGSGWGKAGEAYLEELKELVRAKGLQSNIFFLGFRADANQILREVDVAVQPSLNECLGGSIEALLMECPLVVTRVGGLVDTVKDGQTGIVVRPFNVDDLARGILDLLRDPEKARSYGRAGRKLMLERFTLSRTVNELAELYHGLLSETEQKRAFYDPFVSLGRVLVALPFFLVIVSRLLFVDMLLPIYFPIYLARIRAGILRWFYRLIYLNVHRLRVIFYRLRAFLWYGVVYRLRITCYRLLGLGWRLRALVSRIPGMGFLRRALASLRSESS